MGKDRKRGISVPGLNLIVMSCGIFNGNLLRNINENVRVLFLVDNIHIYEVIYNNSSYILRKDQ
ncbi:MAG: hypothetical protein D8M57_06710 [Candidatus Scalindua sp. AMX11]|nr:MAG: hypothetical protein DWQ00_13685 [Candidatus Scalindua sp.]TDE65772.1 MAG: hypothetical protein D8M57_06710 [Candidatus Scalindua sp. AMX11]GJQ59623.1 MAG: hypothetical protein SCALA701_24240 [Candidatus Scalindua sp.]